MSQHHSISPEIAFPVEHHGSTKRIWKTFWILTVITLVELGIGLAIYNVHKGPNPSEMLVMFFKGAVCILTLAKAYYIVSVFMHLGDEVRNFMMSVVVPLLLFVWFIAAFLMDGNYYRHAKNSNANTIKEVKTAPAAVDKGSKN